MTIRATAGLLVLIPFATSACGSAAASIAQEADLGRIDFPTSAGSEAQGNFIEGVLFLHNFEYEDAATAFRAAQEAEPDFALAYWGEAMTYNHTVWMQQDTEAGLAVLARLGATPQERAAKAPSERERAYVAAAETLFGASKATEGVAKQARDDLYRDDMRRLTETYPDDDEAAAFYALSILGTAHEGRDFATYMRAAAVVEPVFEGNKAHPGAAHYLIHSYDDPVHAPLGLPMAQAYSVIAPDAGHAQHMTSHIFVAMGIWDDVVAANERARDVQNARQARLDRRPIVCGHYTYWLLYGYAQQGRAADTKGVLDTCYERILSEPDAGELGYFADMRARYLLDTGDYAAAAHYEWPSEAEYNFNYAFTTAYAAGMRGELDVAAQIHQDMRSQLSARESGSSIPQILNLGLQGALQHWGGDSQAAATTLARAAEMEAALPYAFGPPEVVKPMYELLGEVLLESGQHEGALAAFKTQLDRTPERQQSLQGLAALAAN